MRKRLIALALSIPLLFGGCSKEYYYLPEGERLCIQDNPSYCYDVITITKKDGRIINCFYEGDIKNPLVNCVVIKSYGKEESYTQLEILKEAERQIDKYLEIIKKNEIKSNKELDENEIEKKRIEEGLRGLK